jgi:glycerol-3-phosphate acyltransferase PlsX
MESIAIDVMSGDRTPRDYVAGVAQALRDDSAFRALLVGDPATIEGALNGGSQADIRQRVEIVPASEVVAMDESPREAIRRKKRSRRCRTSC